MATGTSEARPAGRARRLGAVMRSEDRVTPLELLFGLVFVLALTQCTALMADDPTWGGLAKGLIALGLPWVGYAPLKIVPAFALMGGIAMYLLAHVAARWRSIHSLVRQRLVLSLVLLGLLPVAIEIPALASVVLVAFLLAAVIFYEIPLYGESRRQVRNDTYAPPAR